MPWSVKKDDRCSTAEPWAVVKDDDNELEGCHPSEEAAKKQQAALYASEGRSMSKSNGQHKRDSLVRAVYPGVEVRANDEDVEGMPILTGDLAVFNQPAEIASIWEGRFIETMEPGSFTKTIAENRDRMRILFNHGQDPSIGDKVLAPIDELEQDGNRVRYAGQLFDTSYNHDLVPALKAGQYGSSFRFDVVQDQWDEKPTRSAYNPEGLPERRIKEVRLHEFGPVTFPAYASAGAGIRSLTDDYRNPTPIPQALPSDGAEADEPHSDEGSRAAPQVPPSIPTQETPMQDSESTVQNLTAEQRASRQSDIKARLDAIDREAGDSDLSAPALDEWVKLNEEYDENKRVLENVASRRSRLHVVKDEPTQLDVAPQSTWTAQAPQVIKRPVTSDIYDLTAIRNASRTPADERRLLTDNARRANEIASFPGSRDRSAAQTHVEWLLDNIVEEVPGTLARRILGTGRPIYDQALAKWMAGSPLDNEEARALSLTAGAGGNAVTFDLDPTIMGTSTRQVNPIRALARVIPITGDEWRGVTSGAITTAYAAEATETTDNAPSLTQPVISTEKAQAFVPFSIEIDMDWAGMRGEMSQLLQESKDDLEAVKFTTGTGTNEPFGVIVGATTTVNATTGQTTDAEDFYRLTAALPERYQPRASIMANRAIWNLVRQFVLTGQSNPWKDIDEPTVNDGRVGTLLGYPAYLNSAMASTTATGALFAIIGDFSRFVIIDRIGLNVEVIPLLVGANQRPTGQRGLYAYWRNGSKVINADAFRVLIGIA